MLAGQQVATYEYTPAYSVVHHKNTEDLPPPERVRCLSRSVVLWTWYMRNPAPRDAVSLRRKSEDNVLQTYEALATRLGACDSAGPQTIRCRLASASPAAAMPLGSPSSLWCCAAYWPLKAAETAAESAAAATPPPRLPRAALFGGPGCGTGMPGRTGKFSMPGIPPAWRRSAWPRRGCARVKCGTTGLRGRGRGKEVTWGLRRAGVHVSEAWDHPVEHVWPVAWQRLVG